MTDPLRRAPLVSVALVSSAALATEILLTRIFAVVHWHHFAYMIISLALLGYGASGTALSLLRDRLQPRHAASYVISIVMFAASGLPAFLLAQQLAFSPEELLQSGERAVNLEKAFNSRLGYHREHDQLCHRWLNEEMGEGPGKGWKAGDYLEELKSEYYRWHGWDEETSLPTRAKLNELGLEDVADVLESENCLA